MYLVSGHVSLMSMIVNVGSTILHSHSPIVNDLTFCLWYVLLIHKNSAYGVVLFLSVVQITTYIAVIWSNIFCNCQAIVYAAV